LLIALLRRLKPRISSEFPCLAGEGQLEQRLESNIVRRAGARPAAPGQKFYTCVRTKFLRIVLALDTHMRKERICEMNKSLWRG